LTLSMLFGELLFVDFEQQLFRLAAVENSAVYAGGRTSRKGRGLPT